MRQLFISLKMNFIVTFYLERKNKTPQLTNIVGFSSQLDDGCTKAKYTNLIVNYNNNISGKTNEKSD